MSTYPSPPLLTEVPPAFLSAPVASISWDNMTSSSSEDKNSDDSSVSFNNTPSVFRTPLPVSFNEKYHTRHVTSAGTLYASSLSPPCDAMNSPRSRNSRFRSWTADGNNSVLNSSVPFVVLRSPAIDEDELRPAARPWWIGFAFRLALAAIVFLGCIMSTTSTTRQHPTYQATFSNLHGREVPLETIRKEANEATIETKLVHNKKFIPPEVGSSLVQEQEIPQVVPAQQRLRSKRQPQLYMAKSYGNGPLFKRKPHSQPPSLILTSQHRFSPKSGESETYYHFKEVSDDHRVYRILGWCMLLWCLVETIYTEFRRRSRRSDHPYASTRRVLYHR